MPFSHNGVFLGEEARCSWTFRLPFFFLRRINSSRLPACHLHAPPSNSHLKRPAAPLAGIPSLSPALCYFFSQPFPLFSPSKFNETSFPPKRPPSVLCIVELLRSEVSSKFHEIPGSEGKMHAYLFVCSAPPAICPGVFISVQRC